MVKLTPDLVSEAAQYTNAIKDRELDLRGYKIPLIENLGATLDQFDTIDFSENEIHKLDGFPVLKRLKSLVFNSNKIVRIAEGLEHSIPNLDTLILANNQLQDLSDIDHLSSLKNLEFLVLTKNPVAMKPNYRLYVIHRLPRVRFLDYKRIRLREREQAATMFKSKKRSAAAAAAVSKDGDTGGVKRVVSMVTTTSASNVRTFTPGAPLAAPTSAPVAGSKRAAPAPSPQDLAAIREAIKRAKTLDEVERLNQMLSSGSFAGFAANANAASSAASISTAAENAVAAGTAGSGEKKSS